MNYNRTMIRLLLVEDDANLCYIIRGGLEDMIGGYEIMTADNGETGLRIWKETHPDVIVADIEMPVMDGYEMVRRIRETDDATPILFTSGRVSPKDVVKGYELGVNNYIKKPFLAEELNAHILALLKLTKGIRSVNEEEIFHLGTSFIFEAGHALLKQTEGKEQTLTEREAALLRILCENKIRLSSVKLSWNVYGIQMTTILHHAVWMYSFHVCESCLHPIILCN